MLVLYSKYERHHNMQLINVNDNNHHPVIIIIITRHQYAIIVIGKETLNIDPSHLYFEYSSSPPHTHTNNNINKHVIGKKRATHIGGSSTQ